MFYKGKGRGRMAYARRPAILKKGVCHTPLQSFGEQRISGNSACMSVREDTGSGTFSGRIAIGPYNRVTNNEFLARAENFLPLPRSGSCPHEPAGNSALMSVREDTNRDFQRAYAIRPYNRPTNNEFPAIPLECRFMRTGTGTFSGRMPYDLTIGLRTANFRQGQKVFCLYFFVPGL